MNISTFNSHFFSKKYIDILIKSNISLSHRAVLLNNNHNIINLLLINPNINVNIHNIQGNTPLQLAEMLNQPEIIELIKNHKSFTIT